MQGDKPYTIFALPLSAASCIGVCSRPSGSGPSEDSNLTDTRLRSRLRHVFTRSRSLPLIAAIKSLVTSIIIGERVFASRIGDDGAGVGRIGEPRFGLTPLNSFSQKFTLHLQLP